MELNDIPKDKRAGFPSGVSEHVFKTKGEVAAFIEGVNLPDDMDVTVGTPFKRKEKKKKFVHVVRVKVGDWDDEEDELDETLDDDDDDDDLMDE